MYSKFNKGLFTNLIDGIKTIDKPINQSQANEASLVGLVLLKRSNNPNYNLYRFVECGHTAYMQPTHVRRNNIECKTCLLERNTQKLAISNDQLLFWIKPSTYKVLRGCGHIVDTNVVNIREDREKCSLCFEENLHKVSIDYGYTYLGVSNGSYRKIQFNECGHQKVLHQSQILLGNAVCRICHEDKYKTQAEEKGLILLHRTQDRYAEYKLPCGCTKELRLDHVADGSWLCDIHNDTHYSKPSLVYLLEITKGDFTWLKLGFAKNLELRTNGYGLKDASISSLKTIPFATGREAMLFEKNLHAKFKKYKLSKELMKSYHTFSGYTECYPVQLMDVILAELQQLEEQNV